MLMTEPKSLLTLLMNYSERCRLSSLDSVPNSTAFVPCHPHSAAKYMHGSAATQRGGPWPQVTEAKSVGLQTLAPLHEATLPLEWAT